jgi:hypothetical protein
MDLCHFEYGVLQMCCAFTATSIVETLSWVMSFGHEARVCIKPLEYLTALSLQP